MVALVRSAHARDTVHALGARSFDGDLSSENLSQGMKGCNSLLHAAADTDQRLGSAQQWDTNVEGTKRVFLAARDAGVTRAIFISTDSVLLDGRPLLNATEDHPFPSRPAGMYSHSKAEAERVALACGTPNFATMAVRPRFVWGRDDSISLPQILSAVNSGRFAWIGSGRYATSTTHIANLVHGVALALARGTAGEAYHITDREPIEFREFVTALLATQGVQPPTREISRGMLNGFAAVGRWMAVLSRGWIVPPITRQLLAASAVEVTLNIDKARQHLGYLPIISRELGFAELRLFAKQALIQGHVHFHERDDRHSETTFL